MRVKPQPRRSSLFSAFAGTGSVKETMLRRVNLTDRPHGACGQGPLGGASNAARGMGWCFAGCSQLPLHRLL